MAQNARAEQIAQRYKRTPEQLAEDIAKMEEAKQKLTTSAADLEANLRHFHEILDPICDPINGDALCWIRRPSQTEWEAMVPVELLAYKSDDEVPPGSHSNKKEMDRKFFHPKDSVVFIL